MFVKLLKVTVSPGHISTGSGIISSLSQSQGIIELDEENDYVKKGSLLKFYKYEDMLN